MEKTDLFVDSCTHSPVLGTWISVSHHVVFPWFHFISISSILSILCMVVNSLLILCVIFVNRSLLDGQLEIPDVCSHK